MTCLDMTIQALLALRIAFHQEGKDGENMTLLHTTIRCKDKVSSFLCIIFSYFDNRFLPKDIIIIRNHGEDDETHEGRHGGEEGQHWTSKPIGGPKQLKFESTSDSRNSLR
jgi:hypothetical protein